DSFAMSASPPVNGRKNAVVAIHNASTSRPSYSIAPRRRGSPAGMCVRIARRSAAEPPLRHKRGLVWDLPVRLAHWLLVLGIAGSFLTHYAGAAWFDWHRRCGYGVLVIVAFRLVWGF